MLIKKKKKKHLFSDSPLLALLLNDNCSNPCAAAGGRASRNFTPMKGKGLVGGLSARLRCVSDCTGAGDQNSGTCCSRLVSNASQKYCF